MSDTINIDGYSHWASYLINGDLSGLSEEDLGECVAWLTYNGFYDYDCISCSEEAFFARPDMPGLLAGMCVTYTFINDGRKGETFKFKAR